jgi:hypothetical protein
LLPKPNRLPRKIIALKPLARHYAEHTKSCGAIDRHHEISKGTPVFFAPEGGLGLGYDRA